MPIMPSLFHRAVFIFVWLLLAAPAVIAGGGPTGVVVVYNPNDPRSVTIANEYQQVRGIPERNMVPYAFPTTFSRKTAWDFVYSLRATLKAQGLESQLQSIALAGVTPLNSGTSVISYAHFSLHSFLYLSPNFSEASSPWGSDPSWQKAYVEPGDITGPAPNGTAAMTATTTYAGMRYWPVSSIGFPGRGGNSLREILGFIARAKARDGLKPTGGTIYWPRTDYDPRSRARADEINHVKDVWQQRGIRFVAPLNQTWVSDRADIQGGVVGTPTFTDTGNTYMPGAWVDHLTSFGGMLDTFTLGQTRCSQWLRAGADGTSGSMSEPYASSTKFTHANIHTHIRAGASLVEAYWQSTAEPAELVCLADPLLQPFADFPNVLLTAPVEGATVSGNVLIAATAAPTGGKTLESNLDLFIDGRRIAIGQAGETISATRTAGGFTVNTTTLSDGWHEVRVVAYNNDSIRTQNEAVRTIHVSNAGQSLVLNGPATVNPDGNGTFTVTPVGLGDLTSLTLQANGRTLATLPTNGGSAIVSGSLAPLANRWSVYAVGTRSNGQQIWSAPFNTTVDWPAQPAASTPKLGAAQANLRYFNTTNGTGFNWDTSTPDVTTTFTGNDTTGLYITPTNIPGITFDGTTVPSLKPGYELKCWIYAPVDDWYELGYEIGNYLKEDQGFGTPVSCTVNGVALTVRNAVYGPLRLAQGWHEVRMRMLVNKTAWAYWQVRLRGGASQDFDIIRPSVSASMGTGSNATTPTINSVAPSASPITGTTVTLTTNATGGGGGLTYDWSLLSGPQVVAFSATGTSQPATTVTFTQTGNYVIGLRVAGATDSAFTSVPVSVVAATPSMVISTNSFTSVVRGMPLNVYAYSKDQFGRRIDITPTMAGNRTVNWTTTDPSGSFQNISSTGESAQFVSTSALTANAVCNITATGTNGRTGTATASNIVVATNSSPTAGYYGLFTITKPATSNALVFTASVTDLESDKFDSKFYSPTYPAALLSYQWSVVSTPPGGALALSSTNTKKITGVASAPGPYAVRLTVTDQGGATVSQTLGFYVDADGSFKTGVVFTDKSLHVGETVLPSLVVLKGSGETYQMQTSADGGATWQSLNSTLQTYEMNPDYDRVIMTYGPVTMADTNRLFRINFTKGGLTAVGEPGKITVSNPTTGVIRIKEITSAGGYNMMFISEDSGNKNLTISRAAGSSGAASVDWEVYDAVLNAVTQNGTATWAGGDNSDRVITIPINNNNIPENNGQIYFSIFNATGSYIPLVQEYLLLTIIDDDNAGKAAFVSSAASVLESAGSVSLPVRRSAPFKGPLTISYSTENISAVGGQDFTTVNGTLTWADGDTTDKQIIVPILSDNLIEGDEQFKATLSEPSGTTPTTLGKVKVCTVTVKDAPYQQWQKDQWPASVPTVAIYSDYAAALKAKSPMLQFPLNETSGTLVAGLNVNGTTMANGTLTKNGTGNYTLGQPGPRPLLWPGLPSTNTAVTFTTGNSVTGTPPYFTGNGASLNCGTANGLGSKLGSGFTVSMFIKTSITNREMIIAGGQLTGTYPTTFFVSLNRLHGTTSTATPHAVRIYMAPQGVSPFTYNLDYSVVFENTPTGSICDGQWHHLAITVPPFSISGYSNNPRFYFNGEEVNALNVRGSESIDGSATFSDFSDTGFRLGADGSATPIKFFNGALDEFCFFSRVLSPQDIREMSSAQPASLPPSFMADSANPAGDGVSNLMKYALGLNPLTKASEADLASIQPKTNNTVDFNFTRMRDATDITYRVERRWDLMSGSWAEVYSSSGDPFGSTDPSMTGSLNFDLQGNPKAFFRLKITRP